MSERERPTPVSLAGGIAKANPAMNGLAVVRGMIDGSVGRFRLGELLSIQVVEAEPGRAVLEAEPNHQLTNIHGTVHGGWAATILDSSLGCAVVTTLKPGQGTATVELSVRYMRPILPTGGPVRSEGRVVNAGRRLVVAEGSVLDATTGKLLAQATGTWMVLEPSG